MKITLKIALCLLIALLLGGFSAWFVTGKSGIGQSKRIKNGVWTTSLDTGGSNANLYLRAYIARFGLWALNSSETVYLMTTTDSNGEPLNTECTYRIEGKDPDTRWWSLTVYKNYYLIPNEKDIYSYSKTTIQRNKDGSWTIRASAKAQKQNWLPLGDKEGIINFNLRCYNPSKNTLQHLDTIELPQIIKENCNEK